jgi:hypothetical protein
MTYAVQQTTQPPKQPIMPNTLTDSLLWATPTQSHPTPRTCTQRPRTCTQRPGEINECYAALRLYTFDPAVTASSARTRTDSLHTAHAPKTYIFRGTLLLMGLQESSCHGRLSRGRMCSTVLSGKCPTSNVCTSESFCCPTPSTTATATATPASATTTASFPATARRSSLFAPASPSADGAASGCRPACS